MTDGSEPNNISRFGRLCLIFFRSKWWELNCLRIARFCFAFILSCVILVLSCSYKDVLIGSPIDMNETTSGITLNTLSTTETIGNPKAQAQPKVETKIEWSGSASHRVWAYGLQLAAWTGALGMLLWAIVALCRED